ncbi:hypothetical protein MASR2M44_28490 [Bacteroidota bacterium]
MSIKSFLYTAPLFLFTLVSCKETIDIDIPGAEPLLVVESEITTETDSSFVKLSLSSDYFGDAKYQSINSADVQVNSIPFFSLGNGLYKPAPGFVGKRDSLYTLQIKYNGKTYSAKAVLEPMFRVDSIFQTFKPKEGFLEEGYSVSYLGFDERKPVKYTYFQSGIFDKVSQMDTLQNDLVLFDNSVTPVGRSYSFELPFTRFKSGDEFFCIFRSVDKAMYDFLIAFATQTSGAPGPFQAPPANLPTNITGGAVGYFATYDVVRVRYQVK